MRLGVKVLARLEQRDIRLRLREVIDSNRFLNAHNRNVAKLAIEKGTESIYCSAVSAANRAHLNDLTFDQLDAVVFGKKTDFGHSVKFVDVEAALLILN